MTSKLKNTERRDKCKGQLSYTLVSYFQIFFVFFLASFSGIQPMAQNFAQLFILRGSATTLDNKYKSDFY